MLVPQEVRDFIFDLHDASRRSLMGEEVKALYDTRMQELTDQFYSSSAWPLYNDEAITSECSNDVDFLNFYREITFRRLFSNSKLKSKMKDHIDAWKVYMSLFDFVLGSKTPAMELSTQWAYDIIQEFVYHFQDFCQLRSSSHASSEDEALLAANPGTWSAGRVFMVLFKLKSIHEDASETSSIRKTLGYFAVLEKARLDCLLGDHDGGLVAVKAAKVGDQADLFIQVPSCHASVYYHAGVSMLMLRQYGGMMETLSEIILHISRCTTGSNSDLRPAVQSQLVKIMEKCLAFMALGCVLAPGYRLDVQVQEIMELKNPDRIRRLQMAEVSAFEELFSKICPKFISSAGGADACSETFKRQVKIFSAQTADQLALVKLRSYLTLYSSVDVAKLANLNGVSTDDFVAQLISFKHRFTNGDATSTPAMTDLNYFVENGLLVIETSSGRLNRGKESENFFLSSVRKNAELINDLDASFVKYNLCSAPNS